MISPARFAVKFACRPARCIFIRCQSTFQEQKTFNYASSSDKYNFQNPRTANSAVSCTVLGPQGNVVAISKKYSRTDFLADNGLHPRDLRNIAVAKVSTIIPSILVRPKCILINLLGLSAVVKHDEVMILDSQQDTTKLGLLLYDLENKLGAKEQLVVKEHSTNLPYELKALESILMNAASSLEVEMKTQLTTLNNILRHLEDHIDRDLLKELLIRSKNLSKFTQKSRLVRDVLSDILDSDEDLSAMYLTEISQGIERDDSDHAEAELLLESYYKQVDEIVRQSERVVTNVKSTEEIVNIMLDANRNSLMLMELKITIGTLGFTLGMFLAALYGMNLENFIEESPYGFWSVTGVITLVSALVTWFNFKKLFIVKKVTMDRRGGWARKRPVRRAEWKWLVDRS